MRMLKRRFPSLGVIALLSLSGRLRMPLKFPCEEAEQLLYWVITTR